MDIIHCLGCLSFTEYWHNDPALRPATVSVCVCVCPRALFPKDLANGTVPRSALVLDAGSAALLRIFLHGISPDVLTIKGQQNADCKEKAMSRRKGYWYFRSS